MKKEDAKYINDFLDWININTQLNTNDFEHYANCMMNCSNLLANEMNCLTHITDKMEKGLIIKKVWLDKIFDEGKVWEMRTTKTKVRGKIGLIEPGTGLIVGEANLIGCSHIPIKPNDKYFNKHKVEDTELLKKWKYPWILADAKRYKEPIPYKHPQGAVIWVKL
jgi:hypothetical protein